MVKESLKNLISLLASMTGATSAGQYLQSQLLKGAMQRTKQIEHRGLRLVFVVPNPLSRFRAESFSTKEPETLEWIDGIPEGAVLWDVGANVGLYSCYAAKRRRCTVVAFEPSVFNLELLARNVDANGLSHLITIVPLALSDSLTVGAFNMTSTDWGGALSTFGQSHGHDGRPLRKVFEFRTIGISMSDAVDLLRIPQPDYVKMDVDGLEHVILKGAGTVLRSVTSVLVEINDDFLNQAEESGRYLVEAGLVLQAKRHAEIFDGTTVANCFNQIWTRPVGR